jgi:hypothetical protein
MSKSIELFNEVLEMKESYSKNKSSFLQSIKKDFRDSGTNIQPKSVYFLGFYTVPIIRLNHRYLC